MIKFIMKSLCLHDVHSLLQAKILLSQINCAEYLLPHVVLQAALDLHTRGTNWFWCAPRLFIDDITGQTLGTASFLPTNDSSVLEIGYGTATKFQGMGIASRGVALMLAEAQAHGFPLILLPGCSYWPLRQSASAWGEHSLMPLRLFITRTRNRFRSRSKLAGQMRSRTTCACNH